MVLSSSCEKASSHFKDPFVCSLEMENSPVMKLLLGFIVGILYGGREIDVEKIEVYLRLINDLIGRSTWAAGRVFRLDC